MWIFLPCAQERAQFLGFLAFCLVCFLNFWIFFREFCPPRHKKPQEAPERRLMLLRCLGSKYPLPRAGGALLAHYRHIDGSRTAGWRDARMGAIMEILGAKRCRKATNAYRTAIRIIGA